MRLLLLALVVSGLWPVRGELPSLKEALASRTDAWGEAAMRQPNGASYEFFEPLLPPPRYVHADFRYYPLVLSAPNASTKARLISNGSGVNLRGGSRSWKEVGVPVVFRLGPDEFRFGDLRERLSDPQPADGWMPIYAITYRHPSPVGSEGEVAVDQKPVEAEAEIYREEAFVTTDPALAENAMVFVRFSLDSGKGGMVSAQLDPPSNGIYDKGVVRDRDGRAVMYLDSSWKWERRGARALLKRGKAATLAIATKAPGSFAFDGKSYEKHRALTEKTWGDLIARAAAFEIPEPRVDHAWRNLIAQNFMLLNNDRLFYSAGNQYEALYEAEGSDAMLAMMQWGYEDDAKRMMGPLLAFTRKGLEYHQAGLKLNDIARCWWQTRNLGFVKATRPAWEKELNRILDSRGADNGLLPKERYCGDISTPVHALTVQAKAWRALVDLMPVLQALHEDALLARVQSVEKEFKARVLEATMKSISRETTPPFIPVALLAGEIVHDPISATRIGSYWNIINGYVIGSRLFDAGSEEERWLPRYLETHGGLCMGMLRSGGTAHGFWTGSERVNPLYGTRYAVDLLRRDEPERALVSFYGMLAQGFTRETLVGAEGATLDPVDAGGRFFYCPPNSASNAHFLTMLRNLLVQDFDLNGDGSPETLRLGFATSRRWLEPGKVLAANHVPTAFGPVSVRWESRLGEGNVRVQVELPARNKPKQTLLRTRPPEGWRILKVESRGRILPLLQNDTADLTGFSGALDLRYSVQRE